MWVFFFQEVFYFKIYDKSILVDFCEVFIIVCIIATYMDFVNSCEFFIAYSL